MEEADQEDINEIDSLAQACLRVKGVERPTMKEVDMRLQVLRIKRLRKRHHLPEEGGDIEALLCLEARNLNEHIGIVNAAHVIPQVSSRCYSLEQEFVSSFRPR